MASRNSASLRGIVAPLRWRRRIRPRRFSKRADRGSRKYSSGRTHFEVASTIVQGANSDSVDSSISSIAPNTARTSCAAPNPPLSPARLPAGRSASASKRLRCSFLLMCRKNFRIAVPSSASMRSNSTMSRNALPRRPSPRPLLDAILQHAPVPAVIEDDHLAADRAPSARSATATAAAARRCAAR